MNKRVTILCLVILCLTLCGCKDASTQGLEVGQDKVNNGQEVGGKVEQAAPELLAHALNLDDCEPERSKKSFQDICSYLGRRAEEWTGEYRKLELKEEEREAHMKALAEKYDKMGHFDTGFLATDILTEVLMEYGYADVLLKLLESEQLGSFLHMKRNGATTIWEDWVGSESLCHPMFGGVVRQLLIGFLGICQVKDSVGYEKVEIIPRIPAKLPFAKGSIVTPNGEISVAWEKIKNGIAFEVVIPEGVKATFSYGDNQFELQSGQKFNCII